VSHNLGVDGHLTLFSEASSSETDVVLFTDSLVFVVSGDIEERVADDENVALLCVLDHNFVG